MLRLIFLLGCASTGIKLGDELGSGDTAAGDDDLAAGDDDTGTGDDDTGTTLPSTDEPFSGTVAGTADIHRGDGGGGQQGGGGRLVYCEGPFFLVLHADGTWEGEADCAGEGDGEGFLGPMDGTLDRGRLLGHFAYSGYGFVGDAAVELDRVDDHLDGTAQDQAEGIALSLQLYATKDG